MTELRKNIATDEWVIVTPERAKRPDEMAAKEEIRPPLPEFKEDCPFCPGHEKQSPSEIFRVGSKKTWQIRVVPNKFPALVGSKPQAYEDDGVIQRMPGTGGHEVIIESPLHNEYIAKMEVKQIHELLKVYKARHLEHQKNPNIKYIVIFKNYGARAGTSIEHPHSQVVAMPVVPTSVLNRIEKAFAYYKAHDECVFCRMVGEELRRKKRIVLESKEFVALIPFAAYSPFHTWILPKKHLNCFGDTTDAQLKDLAHVLKAYFLKIYQGLNNPAFNLVIRSLPCGDKRKKEFHWYIAVILRLTSAAGFEMGSGMFINVSLPEKDTAFLRKVEV